MRALVRAVSLVLLGLSASIAAAQGPARPDGANPRRAVLEERLRERMAEVVKKRLALTDAQMSQLQTTNRQFEGQRTALLTRERDVRRELRQQILSTNANQDRVARLLDQVMMLERQRLDIQQNEQRELAKFLTPVQRVKLFGLQNDMRKRMQEMRNRKPRKGVSGN
jgi:Spy/CpxP family protein refolding chaperone